MVQNHFDAQVLKMAALVGGSLSSARFLFQDLSTEAAFCGSRHCIAFCKARDAALDAFAIEYLRSADNAQAHNAACARLSIDQAAEAAASIIRLRSARAGGLHDPVVCVGFPEALKADTER